ncbi:hypothetical protein G7046_g4468 [Stylonectria norvegica]|nr:hypothetical protein G7046_g4468 [Stylonectria norvegica]
MLLSRFAALAILLSSTQARFGQEQEPVAAVSALGNAGFGDPGVAATIAGSIPGALLAAASPCQKLTIADQIITELGTDQQVIDAAIGLVAAETNFNPFVVNVPFVCADASLPASEQLRGIVPLVDPAVGGSGTENANSNESVATPFDATGLSQAEVMIAQGFGNFTAVGADGKNVVLDGQDGAAGGSDDAGKGVDTGNNTAGNGGDTGGAVQCGGGNNNGTPGNGTAGDASPGNTTGDDTTNDGTNNGNNTNTTTLDFGLCQPTMARLGGLNGRPASEFTFIPQDPLVAKGQQEALNPNIITNRICDQLTNVCEANDAAKSTCLAAKAEIEALGTRDQSTADKWNELLGFAGVDSSVDGI